MLAFLLKAVDLFAAYPVLQKLLMQLIGFLSKKEKAKEEIAKALDKVDSGDTTDLDNLFNQPK